MSAEIKKEIELEIAHVLFIDIVGYSKLSINEQRTAVDELNEIVRASGQFQKAEAAGRLIKIPTGDGMALVFYTTPEGPAQCAVEINRALKEHPRLQLRMGVHSGPVSGVIDVNGRANLAGTGPQRGAACDGLRRCRAHSPLQARRRGSRRIRTLATVPARSGRMRGKTRRSRSRHKSLHGRSRQHGNAGEA
jgi:hypothetical protein